MKITKSELKQMIKSAVNEALKKKRVNENIGEGLGLSLADLRNCRGVVRYTNEEYASDGVIGFSKIKGEFGHYDSSSGYFADPDFDNYKDMEDLITAYFGELTDDDVKVWAAAYVDPAQCDADEPITTSRPYHPANYVEKREELCNAISRVYGRNILKKCWNDPGIAHTYTHRLADNILDHRKSDIQFDWNQDLSTLPLSAAALDRVATAMDNGHWPTKKPRFEFDD